jgi:phage terminase large subunit-like protein
MDQFFNTPEVRSQYHKQMQFFQLGQLHNERLLAGGNRSGKSFAGGYEMALHLTGLYPNWWNGKSFSEPVMAWTAGDTAKNVRDIMQTILLGPYGNIEQYGTGLIPGELIHRYTSKHGLSDAIESIYVKHVSGGLSNIQFKSYDQGREVFQGTSQHVIHLDEECPMDIYTECLLRTLTVNGIIYVTATPLLGLTDLMLAFMPEYMPAPEDFAKKIN